MSIICTICARSGSKGVKNKNIRLLDGIPLIAHTIIQAVESKIFDMITVSSDSEEILNLSSKYGADLLVRRPSELATEFISKLPAIRHAVEESELIYGKKFDIIVDMDVTSPLRLIEDIHSVIKLLNEKKVSNIITGSPARRSPYFNLVEEDENRVIRLSKKLANPIFRRQDSPKCYDMNASIYAWKRDSLFKGETVFNDDTLIYIMPEERSVDIDNELDFKIVEMLIEKSNGF
jgi:CMP-N-acetylneuraminic acid synthetase